MTALPKTTIPCSHAENHLQGRKFGRAQIERRRGFAVGPGVSNASLRRPLHRFHWLRDVAPLGRGESMRALGGRMGMLRQMGDLAWRLRYCGSVIHWFRCAWLFALLRVRPGAEDNLSASVRHCVFRVDETIRVRVPHSVAWRAGAAKKRSKTLETGCDLETGTARSPSDGVMAPHPNSCACALDIQTSKTAAASG